MASSSVFGWIDGLGFGTWTSFWCFFAGLNRRNFQTSRVRRCNFLCLSSTGEAIMLGLLCETSFLGYQIVCKNSREAFFTSPSFSARLAIAGVVQDVLACSCFLMLLWNLIGILYN